MPLKRTISDRLKKLPREFYIDDTLRVARRLLGKVLVHETREGLTAGRIVEVEGYIGSMDKASHAYPNLRTKRTEVQFGPGGFAYVFQIYGMYYCFNVVTQVEGRPEVVLVRALEPLAGLELMARRRGMNRLTPRNVRNLANGPGKLCMAMGIGREQNGEDLCGSRLYLVDDGLRVAEGEVLATPRINIDYAEEARDFLWRFIVAGSPFVSKR